MLESFDKACWSTETGTLSLTLILARYLWECSSLLVLTYAVLLLLWKSQKDRYSEARWWLWWQISCVWGFEITKT